MSQELPTFTVTDAQAARLLAVFGTTGAYKAWLRRQIVDAVRKAESKSRGDKVRAYAASLEADDTDPLDGA